MTEEDFRKLREASADAERLLAERKSRDERLDEGIIGPFNLTMGENGVGTGGLLELHEAYRLRDETLNAYLDACGTIQFKGKRLLSNLNG